MRWITLIILFSATFAHADPKPPATQPSDLQVVKTIDDLKKQPLFSIPGAGQVRLGISPWDPELGPWRVVYALQEGDDNGAMVEREQDPRIQGRRYDLGELEVAVKWGDKQQEELACKDIICKAARAMPTLHQTVIPLTKSGEVKLTIVSPAGGAVAWVSMDIKEPVISPWQQFAVLREDEDAEPRTTAAAPLNRVVPYLQNERGVGNEKGLPLLLGEPTLKLSLKKGQFVIKAEKEQLIDTPDENLLARWWVNGKPAVEPAKVNDREELAAEAHAVQVTDTMTVAFGLPENLDVKPGDKVAVQVLYCVDGHRPAVEHEEVAQELRALAADEGAPLLAISNKLEFKVTEAMLKKADAK